MELHYDKKKVETSISEHTEFGVKNPAIIFDILCNRMYTKPLVTCVQEYLCNARDSHREAGNVNTPIKIVLPTEIEPTLLIQDFGVGLSRDRIASVFVFLGESTKRDSNMQTGGFGIGAKSGWSYSGSFGVTTIYNGDKRVYVAFLGDSGVGNLDLVSEETVDETNGTTISLPIQITDIPACINAINRVIASWDTRPVIKPDSLRQKIVYPELLHKGDGWKYMKGFPGYSGQIVILADGIPYPCPEDSPIISKYKLKSDHCMIFAFNTGELDLAVNRESIQVTDQTTAAIETRSKRVLDYADGQVAKALRGIRNYKRFQHKSEVVNRKWGFIKNSASWRGVKVKTKQDGNIQYDFQGLPVHVQKYWYNNDKLEKMNDTISKFDFSMKDIIIVNDRFLKRIPTLKIKALIKEKLRIRKNNNPDNYNKYRSVPIIILNPLLIQGVAAKRAYWRSTRIHYDYPNGKKEDKEYTKDQFTPVIADLKKFGFTMYSNLPKTIVKNQSKIQAMTYYGFSKTNEWHEMEDMIKTPDDYVYIEADTYPNGGSVYSLLAKARRALPDADIPSIVLVLNKRNDKRIKSFGIQNGHKVLRALVNKLKSNISYTDWFSAIDIDANLAINQKYLTEFGLVLDDPLWVEYNNLASKHNAYPEVTKAYKCYYNLVSYFHDIKKPRIIKHARIIEEQGNKRIYIVANQLNAKYPLMAEIHIYNRKTREKIIKGLVYYMNCSFNNK